MGQGERIKMKKSRKSADCADDAEKSLRMT
jgi:hypothetical protein